MNNVFVYLEIEGTTVADVSLELLTKGRKLANQLGCQLEAVAAGSNCFQLAAQLISQFTTFGQEFETDIGYRSAFYLQIYKYVIHNLILSCG